MKKLKRKAVFLIIAVMAVLLCSCGSKKNGALSESKTNSKEYVYSMEEIPIDMNGNSFNEVVVVGDQIYATAYRYEDTSGEGAASGAGNNPRMIYDYQDKEEAVFDDEVIGGEEITEEENEPEEYVSVTYFMVGIFQLDGSKVSSFEIELPNDSGINGFCVDQSGNIYVVLCEYGKDQSDPEMIRDVYTLCCYDGQGAEQWQLLLGKDNSGEDDYYYVNRISCVGENTVAVKAPNALELYSDGQKQGEIDLSQEDDGSLLLLKDGKAGILCYGENSQYLQLIDIKEKKKSDRYDFPINSYNYGFFSGGEHDLLLTDSSGVYYFDMGDESVTKIMDYIDSDISTFNLYNISYINENQFFANYYDEETQKSVGAVFTKVDPGDVREKTVITLACNYLEYEVRKQVVSFNKENEEYRIKVVDYSVYNTSDDYSAGQTKLNTDLITGNVPDILMSTANMPFESYIQKGLFADLNEFLESDPELKKEDYLSNALEALSRNGKLYRISPSFYVFTLLGKTSEVGSNPGWTLADLNALLEKKGDGVEAFSEMTRSSILNYSMWLGSSQFIDWSTGECRFDSQEFMDLLEFASKYPKEIDYDTLYSDESYWNNYEVMYREGKVLLMPTTISNFDDYNRYEQANFGEEITPIGFPTADGNGNAINFSYDFAISSKSDYKQAAWEFIRYFISDEYQQNIEYGFPVKKSRMEELKKKAQEKPFYTDENGKEVEYDNTYYLNGIEVVIEPMTKEKTDRVAEYIESITNVINYDDTVSSIIVEEAEPYFEGQKSAKEVADIIQSRVRIYVNENR